MPAPTTVPVVGTAGVASFELGGDRPNSGPSRFVSVGDFRLSATHITRGDWRSIRNGSTGYTLAVGDGQTPQFPVVEISWFDAAAWCNALSESEGRTPRYILPGGAVFKGGATSRVLLQNGDGYRLVTSQEWEYAARGGLLLRPGDEWSGAHGALTVAGAANVLENYPYTEGGPGELDTIWTAGAPAIKRVGQHAANSLGLFDMSGNTNEWTHTPASGAADYDTDSTDSAHLWHARQRIIRGGTCFGGSTGNLKPNQRTVLVRSGRMPTLSTRVALDGLAA